MKLIKPSFEILEQKPGLDGLLQHIERCGRTCYKSEDKITEESAPKFVDMLVKRGHTAMVEHGTVYLHVHFEDDGIPDSLGRRGWLDWVPGFINKYSRNKYSNVYYGDCDVWVTTNYRVLLQNDWLGDLKYQCEPTEYHVKRVTVKFVCDRGISHKEFVA